MIWIYNRELPIETQTRIIGEIECYLFFDRFYKNNKKFVNVFTKTNFEMLKLSLAHLRSKEFMEIFKNPAYISEYLIPLEKKGYLGSYKLKKNEKKRGRPEKIYYFRYESLVDVFSDLLLVKKRKTKKALEKFLTAITKLHILNQNEGKKIVRAIINTVNNPIEESEIDLHTREFNRNGKLKYTYVFLKMILIALSRYFLGSRLDINNLFEKFKKEWGGGIRLEYEKFYLNVFSKDYFFGADLVLGGKHSLIYSKEVADYCREFWKLFMKEHEKRLQKIFFNMLDDLPLPEDKKEISVDLDVDLLTDKKHFDRILKIRKKTLLSDV